MWQLKNNLFSDKDFPYMNLTTTKILGNMKDSGVRENFCRGNSIDPSSLVTAEQVHGKKIAAVDKASRGKKVPDCDGLITAEPGLALGIFTADCMPIFLGSKNGTLAGLVHAGWRGLSIGIIQEAVNIFENNFNVKPNDISVLIGPHIQNCCYEVSDDLKKIFGLNKEENKLDLSAVAVKIFLELGVKDISLNPGCTCHETKEYFSYRNEKTEKRMMSLVMIKKR